MKKDYTPTEEIKIAKYGPIQVGAFGTVLAFAIFDRWMWSSINGWEKLNKKK